MSNFLDTHRSNAVSIGYKRDMTLFRIMEILDQMRHLFS